MADHKAGQPRPEGETLAEKIQRERAENNPWVLDMADPDGIEKALMGATGWQWSEIAVSVGSGAESVVALSCPLCSNLVADDSAAKDAHVHWHKVLAIQFREILREIKAADSNMRSRTDPRLFDPSHREMGGS